MKRNVATVVAGFAGIVFSGLFYSVGEAAIVRLETSCGDIVVELDSAKAPITVANFLRYVRSSFYDGTIFHRVIKNFMIQGGGLTETMTEKPTDPPIPNEAYNKLSNARGTIAMAREDAPHTATSQFYINHVPNVYLNYKDSTTNARWGYCVFGRVIQGMAVVDSIAKTATKTVGEYEDVPVTPVIIKKAVEVTTGVAAGGTAGPASPAAVRFNGHSLIAETHADRNGRIELYTMNGKCVAAAGICNVGPTVVSVQALSPGMYIFRIAAGGRAVNGGRIVKQ